MCTAKIEWVEQERFLVIRDTDGEILTAYPCGENAEFLTLHHSLIDYLCNLQNLGHYVKFCR